MKIATTNLVKNITKMIEIQIGNLKIQLTNILTHKGDHHEKKF